MVRAPKRTSNPRAAILARSGTPWPYSTMPTRVAARAPNMWEMAIRCGMAVMGTMTPSGMPMSVPMMSPPAIQS